MISPSACRPWQPDRAADLAQRRRFYTTRWDTIRCVRRHQHDVERRWHYPPGGPQTGEVRPDVGRERGNRVGAANTSPVTRRTASLRGRRYCSPPGTRVIVRPRCLDRPDIWEMPDKTSTLISLARDLPLGDRSMLSQGRWASSPLKAVPTCFEIPFDFAPLIAGSEHLPSRRASLPPSRVRVLGTGRRDFRTPI